MTRKVKLLGWFVALALVMMACMPSTQKTVPTLAPNVIQLFVAQTAEAAAAQTLEAIPPTLTFTPTLRSTFTPEPTYTPVPTIVFPTPTPIKREQYFRVKHDTQLAEHDYKSRTAAENWPVDAWGYQTPEVFNMFLTPKMGSGTNWTELDSSWEVFIDALNGQDKRKLNYLKADWTALFDHKGFPYLESKTMGGNVITLDAVEGNWGRVHTFGLGNNGSIKDMNYMTRPDLIQKMVVVKWSKKTRSTTWVNPPPGPIYWPLVSDKPVWITLDWLEPFPGLPMTVSALKTQEIKTEPGTQSPSTGEEFAEGATEHIIKYYPSGSSVWAQLSRGGWIILFHYKDGPNYPTTWKMETLPPPP